MTRLDSIRSPVKKRWIKATYDNQLTEVPTSSLANFAGPPFFEDTVTELYGKKNTRDINFTPTVFAGGTPAYRCWIASGGQLIPLPEKFPVLPTRWGPVLYHNRHRYKSAGETRTASKTYEIKISDPDSTLTKLILRLLIRFFHESISGSAEIRFWN